MSKHTPGPWEWRLNDKRAKVMHSVIRFGKNAKTDIACLYWPVWKSEDKVVEYCSNALLISAAPDLLDALKDARANLGPNHKWLYDKVDAAISKAEGA